MVCVCVCARARVRERERKRKREKERGRERELCVCVCVCVCVCAYVCVCYEFVFLFTVLFHVANERVFAALDALKPQKYVISHIFCNITNTKICETLQIHFVTLQIQKCVNLYFNSDLLIQ